MQTLTLVDPARLRVEMERATAPAPTLAFSPAVAAALDSIPPSVEMQSGPVTRTDWYVVGGGIMLVLGIGGMLYFRKRGQA